jgi:hypothetical protein
LLVLADVLMLTTAHTLADGGDNVDRRYSPAAVRSEYLVSPSDARRSVRSLHRNSISPSAGVSASNILVVRVVMTE